MSTPESPQHVEVTVIHVPSSRRRRWKRIGSAALIVAALALAWSSRGWARLDPPVLVEGATTTRPPTTVAPTTTSTSTTSTTSTTVPEVEVGVPAADEPEIFFIPVPELPPETTTTAVPSQPQHRFPRTPKPAFIPVPDFLHHVPATTTPAAIPSPSTPAPTAEPTPLSPATTPSAPPVSADGP
jgi:hypothetical protein